ncbi:MAG: hypothetical protein GX275_09005 [Clostridiales bacterium]|nr:hypothetical protein [Clostridiales bacterium]
MDIKEYLLKQKSLNEELSKILSSLDSISLKDKEKIQEDNKEVIEKNNELNKENVTITKDRISELKNRIRELLMNNNPNDNPKYNNYLRQTYNEILMMENRINGINQNLYNINIQVSESKTKNNISENKENKFEFKLGVNALTVVGVILILISFITFGRYVYVHYMNNTLKGISLFIVSAIVLGIGELAYRKFKNTLSTGILSLGIAALFSSVIINYLYLRTMGTLVALIVAMFITLLSFILSSNHESNIIRIVSLIGGYFCLLPMNKLGVTESITTIIILSLIGIVNILKPIKKDKVYISFNIYTSIIISIMYFKIIIEGFLAPIAVSIYAIVICGIINVMFFREFKTIKEEVKKVLYIGMYMLISLGLVFLLDIDTVYAVVAFGGMMVTQIIFFLKGENNKWLFYLQFIFTIIAMMMVTNNGYLLTASIILLMIITICCYINEENIFLQAGYLVLLCSCSIDYFNGDTDAEKLIYKVIYLLLLAAALYILAIKNKDNIILLVFKYIYLGLFIELFWSLNIIKGFVNYELVTMLICILFVYASSKVKILMHKNVEIYNLVLIGIISIINISVLLTFNLKAHQLLFAAVLGLAAILLIGENKYKKNLYLVIGIYLTACILRFNLIHVLSTNLVAIITDILLMGLSFISIWLGFKLEVKNLRQYGLGVALLTCAKVILVDLYIDNFVMKTIIYLLVGSIALIISYAYSRIEKKNR